MCTHILHIIYICMCSITCTLRTPVPDFSLIVNFNFWPKGLKNKWQNRLCMYCVPHLAVWYLYMCTSTCTCTVHLSVLNVFSFLEGVMCVQRTFWYQNNGWTLALRINTNACAWDVDLLPQCDLIFSFWDKANVKKQKVLFASNETSTHLGEVLQYYHDRCKISF